MTLAIATAAVIVAVVLLTSATRAATRKKRGDMCQVLLRSDVQLAEAWAQASAETALFLACGLVLGFMREPVIAETARAVFAFVPRGYPGLLVMMVGVPLVTTLGIHPMGGRVGAGKQGATQPTPWLPKGRRARPERVNDNETPGLVI